MRISQKMAFLAAGLAVLAVQALPAAARYRVHPHYYAGGNPYCPVRRTITGALVDCHGWRYRSNAIGWDPSCFNLDYLPSMFACSANRP